MVGGELQVENYSSWLQMTKKGSSELHMENYNNEVWTESSSGGLQMEHVSSGVLRTENESGELQMDNYSNRL